ncbi:MAG: 7-cyano-7-deazaguanine synthase QueC [Desulfovibrio sp.]|jgi:7-cyano-7-deazaguanine synthase|nr:7-cyano-7-deazaguanine synthase QueC [Desulfovibrio sp.]
MNRAVVLFSGGMDSATLLFQAATQFDHITALSFRYGAKHNAYELEACDRILKHMTSRGISTPIEHRVIDMASCFTGFQSNLLKGGGAIPEGHYAAETMKLTVIPGRNLMFLSVAAGYAESVGASSVLIGVHLGDSHIYPDCREPFVKTAAGAIAFSSDNRVTLLAPFVNSTKNEIARIGQILSVPWHLTRSCYKDQELPCGKCGTCTERIEALGSIGVVERKH